MYKEDVSIFIINKNVILPVLVVFKSFYWAAQVQKKKKNPKKQEGNGKVEYNTSQVRLGEVEANLRV